MHGVVCGSEGIGLFGGFVAYVMLPSILCG